tara:strand:+ start:15 stop:860 length:846 start_codon:yes stop_codon:yes gene_type:complete
MKTVRIIPRLDVKGSSLVKGIHFEGLRVLGNPNNFAKYYYDSGADEILYVDVVASLFERNSLSDIISSTAKEIFIPVTVAGGVRTLSDIHNILRSGADKISLNTAAINNPRFIKEASLKYGSSTIVVSIEAVKDSDGKYYAYTDNGREWTGVEVLEWVRKVEELGAGEIIISSIDKEGTGEGYDIELTRMVSESVSIPVIAHGGAGHPNDILDVIVKGKADAVSVASILHYGNIRSSEDLNDIDEGNIEFLKNKKIFGKITPHDIKSIKDYLSKNNINCRI